MALFQNTFDGGTLSATITPENSGGASGTPFNYVEIITGADIEYSGLSKLHGSYGAKVTGNGARAFLQHDFVATKKLSTRFYVRFPSAPTANCQIYTPRHSTNYIGGVNITTALKFQVTNIAGAPLFTTLALTANTWYRVEIAHEVKTATTGYITFKYFAGESTTALETFTTNAADLGTGDLVMYRIGKINSSGNTPMDLDSVTFNTNSVTLLGPHVDINVRPTADPGDGLINIEPGTTVTLNGSGSTDPDGSVASHSWAQTSGPAVTLSGSGATRTFTAPATVGGTVLGFTLTVTDNAGATDSKTVSHSILPATERFAFGGKWVAVRIKQL